MNQLVIAGVGSLLIAGGAYMVGWKHANNARDSQDLAVLEGMEKSREAALKVVEELPKKFIPIKGDVVKEFHHDTRYLSADCSITDPVWVQLRAAYEAAGGRWSETGLPAPGTPTESNVGRNDPGAHPRVGGPGEVSRSDRN